MVWRLGDGPNYLVAGNNVYLNFDLVSPYEVKDMTFNNKLQLPWTGMRT